MKSPIDLLVGLWTDVQRLNPDVKGLERDFETLESRLENEGIAFLTISLPRLGQAFLKGLSKGAFTCPVGFKTAHRGTIPAFLQGMFCEVFDPFSGILKPDADICIVSCLYEILFKFKKYPSAPKSASLLDLKAKKGFIENDQKCMEFNPSPHILSSITQAKSYILSSLRGETETMDMGFRHGPGAVQEKLTPNRKWSAVVDCLFNETFDTFQFGLSDFGVDMLSTTSHSNRAKRPVTFEQASSRISRLISVPKNSTSRRTITVEPVLMQFLQQGLLSSLLQGLDKCPIMSNSVDVTNQSKNQQLALEGSLHDNWATIDLKSASDLISVKLVKIVFGSLPHFYEAMMAARSSHFTVDGMKPTTTYVMEKYAGMGNATCFPVMSITIALICICAILDASNQKVTRENMLRATRHVQVYGDDIVIRREYAHQACTWLSECGLIINTEKSYLEGNFKESCGSDCFKGVNIAPLYYHPEPSSFAADPENCASLVSFSNQAWMRGLYSTSDVVREDVERGFRKKLPLVHTESGALGWHTRLGYSEIHRWNSSLHRFEVRAMSVGSRKGIDPIDGWPALLKFFLTSLLERNSVHLEKSQLRSRKRIVSGWVAS